MLRLCLYTTAARIYQCDLLNGLVQPIQWMLYSSSSTFFCVFFYDYRITLNQSGSINFLFLFLALNSVLQREMPQPQIHKIAKLWGYVGRCHANLFTAPIHSRRVKLILENPAIFPFYVITREL